MASNEPDPEAFRKALEEARRWVESWPDWKQNILEQSSQSTVSVPRPVVVPPELELSRFSCLNFRN
jgi:hypothetical protein